MKSSLTALVVFATVLSLGTPTLVAASGTNWPLKASLAPEQPEMMLGEPILLNYVVENAGDSDLWILEGGDTINRLGRPGRFEVSIVSEAGETVFCPDVSGNIAGNSMTGPVKIPAHGKYTIGLFLPDWARFDRPGLYTITVQRTLNPSHKEAYFEENPAQAIPTLVTARLRVVPTNSKRMGLLVTGLGQRMLALPETLDSESAGRKLAAVHDDRTIPYFIKATQSANYTLRFIGLTALASYNTDAALAAIEQALATKTEDLIEPGTTPTDDTLGKNIRHCAAVALSDSMHPLAGGILLAHRHDPTSAVRLTAVHLLGATRSAEATAMLEEFRDDSDKRIRDEAARYLRERQP